MIREAKSSDADSIARIYNYYIANSTATFEEAQVTEDEITKRLNGVKENHVWLVYEMDGIVRGYAYAAKWKERNAYRFTAEIAIYVENGYSKKGIGNKLMEILIVESKKKSLHKLIAGIALPNESSIKLHEKFGFEKCAHFRESGYKFGRWIDVGYWELIL